MQIYAYPDPKQCMNLLRASWKLYKLLEAKYFLLDKWYLVRAKLDVAGARPPVERHQLGWPRVLLLLQPLVRFGLVGPGLVLLQFVLSVGAEGARLDLALERLGVRVGLLVPSELAGLHKGLAAHLTLVVAVPVVGPHVGL